jgi:hypothetical protein
MDLYLLLFLFWSVGPALLASWVFAEGGKDRAAGFLIGFVLGPPGVLAASLLVKYSGSAGETDSDKTLRAARLFYDVPVLGRLHVSTVWTLAGVATFVCGWGAAGLAYEIFRAGPSATASLTREGAVNGSRGGQRSQPVEMAPGAEREAGQGNSRTREGATQLPQTALVNGLTAAPRPQLRPEGTAGMQAGSNTASAPAEAGGAASGQSNASAQPVAGALPLTTPAETPPPAPRPAAPSRQAAAAEAARQLASNGHRVHASLSGDERTTTLSLSGATLTRAAGNQLLGNGRLREALKAAGVRIVVIINGSESWTYIL